MIRREVVGLDLCYTRRNGTDSYLGAVRNAVPAANAVAAPTVRPAHVAHQETLRTRQGNPRRGKRPPTRTRKGPGGERGKECTAMANTFEVTCVTRNEQAHPQEQVTHIGGINGRGRGWRLTRAEAIDGIMSGRWSFYVSVRDGKRATLVVGVSQWGAKYLKTDLDNGDPATLLSLPTCNSN